MFISDSLELIGSSESRAASGIELRQNKHSIPRIVVSSVSQASQKKRGLISPAVRTRFAGRRERLIVA
jgi:hypothetical protein